MNWKGIIIGIIGLLFGAAGVGFVDNVFLEFGTFVVGISLFAEWVIEELRVHGFLAKLITWGTGAVFAFLGWWLGLGFLASVELWWHVAIYGVAAALIGNGMWPEIIKKILEWLGLYTPKQ